MKKNRARAVGSPLIDEVFALLDCVKIKALCVTVCSKTASQRSEQRYTRLQQRAAPSQMLQEEKKKYQARWFRGVPPGRSRWSRCHSVCVCACARVSPVLGLVFAFWSEISSCVLHCLVCFFHAYPRYCCACTRHIMLLLRLFLARSGSIPP